VFSDTIVMDLAFIKNNNIIVPVETLVTLNVPQNENMYHADELTFDVAVARAKETGAQRITYFEANTDADTSVYNNSLLGIGKYFVTEYLVNMPEVSLEPVTVRSFLSPFNPFFSQQQTAYTENPATKKVNSSAWTTMFEISLPYNVPHVFVANMTGENTLSKIGIAGLLPATNLKAGETTETVTLEGPFSKWFTTVTAKGENLSAFMVLAPNLMDSLMSFPYEAQVEFAGKKIYLTKLDGKVKQIHGVDNIGVGMSQYTSLLDYGLKQSKLLVRASRPAGEVQPMKTFTNLIAGAALKAVARIAGLFFAAFMVILLAFIAGIGLLMSIVEGTPNVLSLLGVVVLVPVIGTAIFRIWNHRRLYLKMRKERMAYAQGEY